MSSTLFRTHPSLFMQQATQFPPVSPSTPFYQPLCSSLACLLPAFTVLQQPFKSPVILRAWESFFLQVLYCCLSSIWLRVQDLNLSTVCFQSLKAHHADSLVHPLSSSRSYQCPPNSCRNPVIPAESSGIKFGRKACYFFSFWCLLFQQNLGILELRLECSAEFAGTECNGIQLFVCLFVCFTPVTK